MEGYGKALRIKEKLENQISESPGTLSTPGTETTWDENIFILMNLLKLFSFLPFFMPPKRVQWKTPIVFTQVLCLRFAQRRRGYFAWTPYLDHRVSWCGEEGSVMGEAGCWVRTETLRCMPCIGNILVLGGATGAHFVTYIDVMLFFCMYQVIFENNNKPLEK